MARPGGVSRWWIAAVLVLLTAFAHEGVRRAGFLSHDDDLLVSQNPIVRQGLTLQGVRWAFAADLLYDSRLSNYWTPLAVLSHMVDVSLFGMNPMGHHLMNLGLHVLNVLLALVAFERLTGARWRSAFVAAILAVHPVHVESVAWVAERKDVLSGAFWLAALLAYAAYAARPSARGMLWVAGAMMLGLLAKPMLITLPFVLLLLDAWPLRRPAGWRARVVEKWPLFLLAAASVAVTTLPNLNGRSLVELSLAARLTNAVGAYAAYLRQAFWPAGLGVAYAHLGASLSGLRLAACVGVLAAVSVAALVQRRSRPYLAVGWCWFLGVLFPVIGLVQSGSQGWADRYMYLPMMGLSLSVAWLVGDWARTPRCARGAAGLAATLVLLLALLSRRQVSFWTDDRTLFARAVAVSPSSEMAHLGLGAALAHAGDLEGAETEYREALRRKPDSMFTRLSLSSLLALRGRADEGRSVLHEALDAHPDRYAFERGLLAAREGRAADAMQDYAGAVAENPAHHAALYNWGNLLAASGRMDEAVDKYRAADRLAPDDSAIANNLGLALLFSGHVPEALDRLSAALRLDPENAQLRTSHGLALSAAGQHAEAEAELREAVRLDPKSADAREALEAERRRR
jgi:tetratricopeptide (TPR) repeat protein